MQQFNIQNNSGALLTLQSLDGLQIANGATVNIFDSAHGKFTVSDVVANTEIQNLLDSQSIQITDINGGLVVNLRLYFGIIPVKISPPQITVHVDDWNPSGFATASVVNVDILGIKEIRGFLAGNDGDRKLIINTSNYELKLMFNSATSQPNNRIYTVEQAPYKIQKFGAAEIIYDKSISRWRVIDKEK
jgi:hypothetical protein